VEHGVHQWAARSVSRIGEQFLRCFRVVTVLVRKARDPIRVPARTRWQKAVVDNWLRLAAEVRLVELVPVDGFVHRLTDADVQQGCVWVAILLTARDRLRVGRYEFLIEVSAAECKDTGRTTLGLGPNSLETPTLGLGLKVPGQNGEVNLFGEQCRETCRIVRDETIFELGKIRRLAVVLKRCALEPYVLALFPFFEIVRPGSCDERVFERPRGACIAVSLTHDLEAVVRLAK